MYEEIKQQAAHIAREIIPAAKLHKGDIVVVGCSSSEILGQKIGTFSSQETGAAVFAGLYEVFAGNGIHIAAQCCEHLNRALIVEREVAEKNGYQMVNVVPQPKAGGSFATAAYVALENPVAIESVSAAAGIDIGDTLIGMHLRRVAVPLRLSVSEIGQARVVCARTRLPFIGGSRAVYDDSLL